MPEKSKPSSTSAREQRLAVALRENLKRRKAQAREQGAVEALPKAEETS